MRILFVVQRFGAGVAGGSEAACREYALRMASRGHEVEVITSCARSYLDWENEFPQGTEQTDDILIHRLPVRAPRDDRLFGPINARVVAGEKPIPLYLQEEWMRLQGPDLLGLEEWIAANVSRFDVLVFFTYLYNTTWVGLRHAASVVPTILHPTAHDEPPIYLSMFDLLFRMPSAMAFFTPEEAQFVRRRFGINPYSLTLGVGMDPIISDGGKLFRQQFGLGQDPYLLFLGRVDPAKGSDEIYGLFNAYKERNPGALRLVIAGDPVRRIEPRDDVLITGYLSEENKRSAVGGSLALVQPSYFESFSIVLLEAWAQEIPVLVQGNCDVLLGQVMRSSGGIPYRGFWEFEAAVDLIASDESLRQRLGLAGRRYTETHFRWDSLMPRYERFLRLVASKRAA